MGKQFRLGWNFNGAHRKERKEWGALAWGGGTGGYKEGLQPRLDWDSNA